MEKLNDEGNSDHNSIIERRLTRLESSLESLVKDFHTFVSRTQQFFDRQVSNSRTDWSIVIGAVMLGLAIVGVASSGYVRDLEKLEAQLIVLHDENRTLIKEVARQGEQLRSLNSFFMVATRRVK